MEYMLPAHASQLFATMSQHCAPGSRLVASLVRKGGGRSSKGEGVME